MALLINPYRFASASFDPASIFAVSAGCWLDPQDMSKCFQNHDGTTAVTSSMDRIRWINDASPNAIGFEMENGAQQWRVANGIACIATHTDARASGDIYNGILRPQPSSAHRTAWESLLASKSVITTVIGVVNLTNEGSYGGVAIVTDNDDGKALLNTQGAANANGKPRYQFGTNEYAPVERTYPYYDHILTEVDYQAGTWSIVRNNVSIGSGSFTGGSNSPTGTSSGVNLQHWQQRTDVFYFGVLTGTALTSQQKSDLWTWGQGRMLTHEPTYSGV